MKQLLCSGVIIVLAMSFYGCANSSASLQETQQNTINDEGESTETTTFELIEEETNEPIIVTDKVGKGCTYYQYSTNRTYVEGSSLPTPQNYDNYITNDYTYWYFEEFSEEDGPAWVLEVNDTKKSIYEPIITSISGVNVSLCRFTDCVNMKKSPKLPDTITVMYYSYKGCTSLIATPEIPEGVTSMKNAFEGCTSLIEASIIPNSVTDLESAFSDCKKLTGTIVINAQNVISYNKCFNNVNFSLQQLNVTGTSPILNELKATGIGDNGTTVTQPTTETPIDTTSVLSSGQKIVTDKYEFTLNKVELAYEVRPDNPPSLYQYYPAESGKVYIHVDMDIKNLQKQNMYCDEIFTVTADYNNGYTYKGFETVEDDDGDFTYANITYITPLETKGVHGLVKCPEEVASSINSLFVIISFTDGREYKYIIR